MSLEDRIYPLINLYYSLPEPLSQILGKTYRAIPDYLTKGQAYVDFVNIAHEKLNDEGYIEAEFIKTMTAAKSIPFYTKLYNDHGINFKNIQNLTDLKNLPTINKDDVKANFDQMFVPSLQKKGLYLTTGGSTGKPVGFYLEKGRTRAKESAFIETMWSQFGFNKASSIAIIRGLTVKSKDGISRYDSVKNALILSSSKLTLENVPAYINKLNNYKPDFIQAYPSSIYLLARMMRELGLTLNFKPKCIFCGSENLYNDHKVVIESVFRAPVFSWYGHTERVLLAKLKDKNRYEFLNHYGIAELINEEGCGISEGTGELCGTSLHNNIMPLIRYKTEDLASISQSFNRRRLTDPLVVDSIDGRSHEFVYSDNQRPISMTLINMHSDIFDKIERFQFNQSEYGFVEFIYTSETPLTNVQQKKIKQALMDKLGVGFYLSLKRVPEISLTKNGKQTFLKQNIK